MNRSQSFIWKIVAASGVLVFGHCNDFLLTVERARREKAALVPYLPHSNLRVNLFYPNGKRVPQADIKAALRALDDEKTRAAVAKRSEKIGSIAPARSEASTAASEPFSGRCLGFAGLVFSQAGVVAPPDGLNFETLPVFSMWSFSSVSST